MAEFTYYFDSYDIGGDEWETNPEQMVDNNLETFASTIARDGSQVCLTNTCPGVDLGTITKVELRVYAYGDGNDLITPFSIQEDSWGNIHPGTEPGWSSWLDITLLDPPIPWTWATLQSFQVRIVWTNIGKANRMYCAKVEIRVTTAWVPPGKVTQYFAGNDFPEFPHGMDLASGKLPCPPPYD